MKKIFLLLFSFALFVFSASCTKVDGDPFLVFSVDFCAEIELTCEESESKIAYDSAKKSIEFLSPDELSGYRLRLESGTAYLSYGDTEIPVSKYAGRIAYVCECVFAAKVGQITEIRAQKVEGETLTVVKTDGITYTFSSDGAPLSVCGYYDGAAFEMTFLSFTGAM